MRKAIIPAEPLWPIIMAMCTVVKNRGGVLKYEDAEAAFFSLVKAGEEELAKGVQYGGAEVFASTNERVQ